MASRPIRQWMDDRVGGNAAASWLETAARDELLRFFLYLGVDMESVSDEDLVGQVDWAVAQLPNAVGTAYVKYCASAALPVRRRVFDVQVFQSRVDVSTLNSSGAECGTVSARVESDGGVSPRDTDSGRAPGDSRSEASRLQQPAGVPAGGQQQLRPAIIAGEQLSPAAMREQMQHGSGLAAIAETGEPVVDGEYAAHEQTWGDWVVVAATDTHVEIRRYAYRVPAGSDQEERLLDGPSRWLPLDASMQDLGYGDTLTDDYVVCCDYRSEAPRRMPPGELGGGRLPYAVAEGDSADGEPAGAVSTEDSSRAAEAERLLREQSPLPLGGRQPEVSGGEHSHDAELNRASAHEFSDADDRAARHSGADASESRLRTMLETSMRENESQRVLVRELQADVEDLKDPRKQFERAQQISMDPAWRATAGIGKNKLSAAQINRLQSYKLSEEVIVQLVEDGILPPFFPDASQYMGTGAFRKHLPKEQQLPMGKLQRELLKQEIADPENWPERDGVDGGTDYSWIAPAEWMGLSEAQKNQVRGCNDRIQSAFGELKHVVYPAAVLADKSVPAEERCTIAREFYRVQCLLLFDDIAAAEKSKLGIAKLNLNGGIPVQSTDGWQGPQLLGPADSDERKEIELSNSLLADASKARKNAAEWVTVAKRGGAGPGKKAKGEPKFVKGNKGAADKDKDKSGGKSEKTDKSGGGAGKKKQTEDVSKVKCFNCRERGHRASDCPKPDSRTDADQSKKVDGSKGTKSPSNERSGYTAGHHADPSADKAARDEAERSSRHVQRKEGGQ